MDHLISFYRIWDEIRSNRFDGFIITGAPVEHLPFEEVTYWDELRRFFDWTQNNVHRCLNVCWGAQAALKHFHGVPKHNLPEKAFGVFRHRNLVPTSPYLRGFSDEFWIPVSRWTEVRRQDLPEGRNLKVLAEGDETGLCLVGDPLCRSLHNLNHAEYDASTLADEFHRDLVAGTRAALPKNYFPQDDCSRRPPNRWRSDAHLLIGNWINEIYQTTPFDWVTAKSG
jgi:homoserine O-succinyltransferase